MPGLLENPRTLSATAPHAGDRATTGAASEPERGLFAMVYAYNVRRAGRAYADDAPDALFDVVAAFNARRAAAPVA